MLKNLKLLSSLAVLISMTTAIFAGNITSVDTVTLSNPNPAPGETVQVNWTYTQQDAFNDPRAIILVSDQCSLRPAATGGQQVLVGDSCVADVQVSGGCDIPPDNVPAGSNMLSRSITIPTNLVPGNNYCVIVAMKNYGVYLNPGPDISGEACTCWSVPLPPPTITLSKIAEGTSAAPNGLVLFTIFYYIANTTDAVITDVVDSDLSIVQVYDGGSAVGQTITWNFPGYTGPPQTGTVSFLAQVGAAVPGGTVIPNQATASSNEVGSASSNNAAVTVNEVGLALQKSASLALAATGDTITYTVDYQTSGSTLEEYQNFSGGAIPGGWTIPPEGSWTAASGYLEQTISPIGGPAFPAVVANGMTPVHDAVYLVDMFLPSSTDTNFDDLVFQFNSDAGHSNFYMARMSVDTNELGFDSSTTYNIVSVASPHGYTLMHDVWYSLKVEVVCGNIQMKIWPRTDSEPAAWALSTVDNNFPLPGIVGLQVNNGSGAFDNLKVFSLTGGINVRIWDTLPVGTSYIGCSGGVGCNQSAGLVTWNVGGPCSNQGAVEFYVEVTAPACDPDIVNDAGIDSDDPPPAVISNQVTTSLGTSCNSPTPTVTLTSTLTLTATPTHSPTRSITPSNTSTFTLTATVTDTVTPGPTPTYTWTPTYTATFTMSFTATDTVTPGPSPTYTWTPTATPTFTPTFTITDTSTPGPTATFTATLTHSPTLTATCTVTLTATQSATRTVTLTATRSATESMTPTLSPSFTVSPTVTVTRTPIEIGPLIEEHALYPNPFEKELKIFYLLRWDSEVTFNVYNVAGERIYQSVFDAPIGDNLLVWPGENSAGARVASGVYILRLYARGKNGQEGDFWAQAAAVR